MRVRIGLVAVLLLEGCAGIKLGAKPADLDCASDLISRYSEDYGKAPQFEEIQRDAGHDNDVTEPIAPASGAARAPTVSEILEGRVSQLSTKWSGMPEASRPPQTASALILSGGGEWGAFGAGYLNQMHRLSAEPGPPSMQRPLQVAITLPRKLDVVTGVSTGALQALFIGADQFDPLEREYTSPDSPARDVGLLGVLTKGYLADTSRLRGRLESLLCTNQPSGCALRDDLVHSSTQVFIGLVESRSGDFKAVNISAMLKDADATLAPDKPQRVMKAARCVAAVTLASTAVPVMLQSVRLHDPASGTFRSYVDGGVRLSVFDALVAKAVEDIAKTRKTKKFLPNIAVDTYVVRNGPTVVEPRRDDPTSHMSDIDLKPSADRVAISAYRTLVNQNEVMSIAALRLFNPSGRIFVATADGYATHWPWRDEAASERCTRTKGGAKPVSQFFDIPFMQCLARWGAEKARHHPSPWIELKPAVDAR